MEIVYMPSHIKAGIREHCKDHLNKDPHNPFFQEHDKRSGQPIL